MQTDLLSVKKSRLFWIQINLHNREKITTQTYLEENRHNHHFSMSMKKQGLFWSGLQQESVQKKHKLVNFLKVPTKS